MQEDREKGVKLKGDAPKLYVKDKKIDLSFIDSLETDKLVELPADFMKIIDANEIGVKKKKKKADKAKAKTDEKEHLVEKQNLKVKKEEKK